MYPANSTSGLKRRQNSPVTSIILFDQSIPQYVSQCMVLFVQMKSSAWRWVGLKELEVSGHIESDTYNADPAGLVFFFHVHVVPVKNQKNQHTVRRQWVKAKIWTLFEEPSIEKLPHYLLSSFKLRQSQSNQTFHKRSSTNLSSLNLTRVVTATFLSCVFRKGFYC